MGQILHPRATTTAVTRQKIQNSKKSITKLAKEYGINLNGVFETGSQENAGGQKCSSLQKTTACLFV